MSSQSIGQGQGDVAAPWANLPRTPSGRRGSQFWRVTVYRWSGAAVLGIPVRRYAVVAAAILLVVALVAWACYVQTAAPPQPAVTSHPYSPGSVYVKAPRSVFQVGWNHYLVGNQVNAAGLVTILLVAVAVFVLILGSVGAVCKRSRILFCRWWGIAARGPCTHRELLLGLTMESVAAVQICSGYGLFEMNLVVPSVPGWRIPLVCHSRGKVLRRDARRLAAFLKVPLLDHADTCKPGKSQ